MARQAAGSQAGSVVPRDRGPQPPPSVLVTSWTITRAFRRALECKDTSGPSKGPSEYRTVLTTPPSKWSVSSFIWGVELVGWSPVTEDQIEALALKVTNR